MDTHCSQKRVIKSNNKNIKITGNTKNLFSYLPWKKIRKNNGSFWPKVWMLTRYIYLAVHVKNEIPFIVKKERKWKDYTYFACHLYFECFLNACNLLIQLHCCTCISIELVQLKKKEKNYWTLQMLTLMTDTSILLFKIVQWNKYYKCMLYSVLRSSCCKTRISCIQKFIPTETCNFKVVYWQPIKRYDSLNYT